MKKSRPNTYRKKLFCFFSKSQRHGRDVTVGLEISESAQFSHNPTDINQSEGRVQLRFFNTAQRKSDQIRFSLSPFEAFDASRKIHDVSHASGPLRLEMPSHTFSLAANGDNQITTSVTFERCVQGSSTEYAITASRKDITHNIRFHSNQIIFVAEILKFLSLQQGWNEFLVPEDPLANKTN